MKPTLAKKQVYQKPTLKVYGSVEQLTRGNLIPVGSATCPPGLGLDLDGACFDSDE
ncbi:MAG: lasso RiPP family leader peptide-containing protein [Cyanobacteria bacterium P01_F01_bin.150]